MRFPTKICLTMALATLLVASTQAQPPRQGGGRTRGFGGGSSTLLRAESVQKELKMTEEQVKKISEATQSIQAKLREKMQGIPRDQLREKFREIMENIQKETQTELAKVLNKDQQKRLEQIQLQASGLRAFSQETVQKKLDMDEDQLEDVKKIMDDYSRESRALFRIRDREESTKKREALQKTTQEKMDRILSDSQKAKWKEMVGAKFDTSTLRQRRSGGNRSGGGNRNRFSADSLLERFDKNKNEKIEKSEVEERTWNFLSRMDGNKDDAITKKELEEGLSRFRQGGGNRPGGSGRPGGGGRPRPDDNREEN